MRFLKPILAIALTGVVVFLLGHPLGPLPPLGNVLDPVNGAMAEAEPTHFDFNKNLKLPSLQAPVEVWFEDRLVPHIRAQNDHDLYYTQGYVHAYFRLWQMDLQTRAAAGRVAEVAGKKALGFDRGQRRKGMVYAAEQALKAMEAEPRSKAMLDAYRDGINAFIDQTNFRELPIEYKLMNFRPEAWTNLRSALLLKYMADDLTGKTDDIAFTVLRQQLGEEQFDFLFPERIKGSIPVIPEGTKWEKASLQRPAVPEDPFVFPLGRTSPSVPLRRGMTSRVTNVLCDHIEGAGLHNPKSEIRNPKSTEDPEPGSIGSNNWAVSGKLTASGAPILCNDPHLGLNLPSLWYEVQLTAPGVNVYGVSLPGAPGVVIGFNDSLSWGVTNNYRDVKDYFQIKTLDADHYQFEGAAVAYQKRSEVIKSKDSADMVDTMRYTVQGPVQFDPSYPDPQGTGKTLACCWMAYRPSNELLSLYLLNRAQNYEQYVAAIHLFECPAQNFVYADRAGNIAMWGQGRFINKWNEQGKFIMNGDDRRTMWGDTIPMRENPHVLNPEQGYVASANQITTDSTYPYWYNGGGFVDWRAWQINSKLSSMKDDKFIFPIRPASVQNRVPEEWLAFARIPSHGPRPLPNFFSDMQNDNHSFLAAHTLDTLLQDLMAKDRKDFDEFLARQILDPSSIIASRFQVMTALLYKNIWADEFPAGIWPSTERTVDLLLNDPSSSWFDDKRTTDLESRRDIVQKSYDEMNDSLKKISGSYKWYRVKNTSLTHLARIKAFSYDHLPIGGWSNTINATASKWGPSWRMIVQMGKDSIEAWGVYPGGPSGNPGSRFYGNLIDDWVKGTYRKLLFLPAAAQQPSAGIRYVWKIRA